MATDRAVIQLINQRFDDLRDTFVDMKDDLSKRLDVMDAKNDNRDLRVNTMDAENRKRLDALEKDVGFVKNLFKAACALVAAGASAMGIYKGLR